VALLITGVLWDVVEVFAADDDGSVHLCGLRDCVRGYVLPDPREPFQTYHNLAGQDTATDGNETGERALLVDVGAVDGGLRRAET